MFTVTIVDQSEDDATEMALQPFLQDPRMRYIRSASQGLSIGRNIGIENSTAELVAITDDDCELPPDWLRQFVRAFELDERIGAVFGKVLPGPHDAGMGFVPSYVFDTPSLARSIYEKHRVQGVGACMGVRRGIWQELGGFDPLLGVGAPLRAGEEIDLAIRVLSAGHFVYETPEIYLVHHGSYTWQQGAALIYGYWYGTGAVFGKFFRARPFVATHLLAALAFRWISTRSPVASSLGRQPRRWLQLRSFLQGFIAGMFTQAAPGAGDYRSS